MRPVRCPVCREWRPSAQAAEEHCATKVPMYGEDGRCPHCGGDLTADTWCSRCGQNPQEPLDAEIVELDDEPASPGYSFNKDKATLDIAIVEDDSPQTLSSPWTGREVELMPHMAIPTGPDLCWWRIGGPTIRDNVMGRMDTPTRACDQGVVDVITPDGDTGLLAFRWKDGSLTTAPVAGYRVKWKTVTVKEGWSDAPEDTTHHVSLQFVDILVTRPPALPEPTDWQQMTRRGDRTYPGEDLTKWAFNNPWDGVPPGQYPYRPPREKRNINFSINIGTQEACRIVNEQAQLEGRRRELEQ